MFLIWWRELERRRGGKEEVMEFKYKGKICGLKKNGREKRREKSYWLAVLGEEKKKKEEGGKRRRKGRDGLGREGWT